MKCQRCNKILFVSFHNAPRGTTLKDFIKATRNWVCGECQQAEEEKGNLNG